MELPVIVERVTYRKANFSILACNLDPYSSRYSPDLEIVVSQAIDKKWNSFTVLLENLDENEDPTGGQYVLVGDFVDDVKRGRQYKANFYYQDSPSTTDGLKIFLMSLPNIKESRSHEILEKFGLEGTIDILENSPYRLTEIRGITSARVPPIKKAWDEKKYMRELYEWMNQHDIPIKLADKAFKRWQKNTMEVLQENPYRLTELKGIGFHTADRIAHKLDGVVKDDFRVVACMRYCLEEDVYKNSNLCTPWETLKSKVITILKECDDILGKEHTSILYSKLLPECLKNNLDHFVAVKNLKENKVYAYLRNIWVREVYIGKKLFERSQMNSQFKCDDNDVDKAEKNISFFVGREIELDDMQKEAIKSAFNNRITIITGGGGTGKSTICRCIFSLAREKGLTINMMSPTGKAAQVLSEKTGGHATTIHRGLEMVPDDIEPKNIITQDILLIDEISMSGIDTMYAIMFAINDNPYVNIVFVGDKNQLPSVSPGNFLSDIIKSKCANVVTLNRIHRQDENSYISIIANNVSKGCVVEIPVTARDIKWHKLNADKIDGEVLRFIDEYIKNGNDINDLQFISPMKKGVCGVFRLNKLIQEKMSEIHDTHNNFLERQFDKFYIQDRVIQIENNYEKDVFNGDMGIIEELGEQIRDPKETDKKEKYVIVDFLGEKRTYYGSEMDQLMLAWVITVHKFQGSQSKNIVMFMASEAQIMMNKELVYTGFTRAEKQLDIFGHEHMYRLAPSRSIIKKRFTNLVNIIEQTKTQEKILKVLEK